MSSAACARLQAAHRTGTVLVTQPSPAPPYPARFLPLPCAASLVASSPCSPGSPPDPGAALPLARRGSKWPVAPAFPPHVASSLHSRVLTAHKGGKKADPTGRAGAI